jgi:hypothetical protein
MTIGTYYFVKACFFGIPILIMQDLRVYIYCTLMKEGPLRNIGPPPLWVQFPAKV